MKKKSVFLSKVFAVALAASMAFSTPYVSAELVTDSIVYEGTGKQVSEQSTEWWTRWSDFYRVSGDFDVTFEIDNKSDGSANYTNTNVILSSAVDYAEGAPNNIAGYNEYLVMRADNWCWSPSGDNVTVEGVEVVKECNWNWDTMATVMTNAKITLNIKRTGDDFEVTMTVVGSDNNTYNQSYKFNTKADKDINIFFSGDHVDSHVLSYTANGGSTPETPTDPAPETPEDPADTVTPPAIDVDPGDNTAPAPETPEDPSEDLETPTDPTPETPEDPGDEEEPATTTTKAAKLSKTKLSVKVGKSKTLKVKNTSKKVTWSSSNKKVAKVNKSGKVTGVKAGKATIKAKVGNKTLKCTVTVK